MGFRDEFADAIEKQEQGEDQALIYGLGEMLCLVPLKSVIDVVTPEVIRSVPSAMDFFSGFFIYEKKPVILINTALKMGIGKRECPEAIIYDSEKKGRVAFSISGVVQVIPYNDSYIQPINPENQYPLPIEFIEKVFNINQNIIFQIDLSKLV